MSRLDLVPAAALLLSVASSVLFLVVGRTIQRRPVSPEARQARTAFAVWWYGIGALTVFGTAMSLPGFPLSLGFTLAATVALVAVLCAALAGLVHYLVFLYTSRHSALAYIAAGYLGLFLLFLEFLREGGPNGIEDGRFGPQLTYAHQVTSGPLYVAVIVLLLAPPVAAALAYLSLYWRVEERLLKRRILIVSTSIAVWFGSSVVGLAPSTQTADWWVLTSKVIALAAAGAILYAYTGLRPAPPQATKPAAHKGDESLYESDPRGRASSFVPALA